jgi:hypothetical protein
VLTAVVGCRVRVACLARMICKFHVCGVPCLGMLESSRDRRQGLIGYLCLRSLPYRIDFIFSLLRALLICKFHVCGVPCLGMLESSRDRRQGLIGYLCLRSLPYRIDFIFPLLRALLICKFHVCGVPCLGMLESSRDRRQDLIGYLCLRSLPYRMDFIFPLLRALAVAGVCHMYLGIIPKQFLWLGYLVLLYISSDLRFCLILGLLCISDNLHPLSVKF